MAVGEALVEVMRPCRGLRLDAPGPFVGPFPSGAPAIVAHAAARAGADTALVAAVGDDPLGRIITRRLRDDGVDVSGVRVVDSAVTGVAFVAYDDAGGREFVFRVADAAPSLLEPGDFGSTPEQATWLHVSGSSLALSDRLAGTVLAAVERVVAAGGRVSFDPNLRTGSAGACDAPPGFPRMLEVASLLLPGEGELDALGVDVASLARDGVVICEAMGKRGVCVHHGDTITEIPATSTEEVDPTGAGDTFSGAFLAAYLRGEDPATAAREGSVAAAAHVAALGPMESDHTAGDIRAPARE